MSEIDFSRITACGECCDGCPKKMSGLCKGCIEADGFVPEWAESGRCKIYECARAHGARFCGLCGEFPCERLPFLFHWNPDIAGDLKALAEQYRGLSE